MKSGLDQILTKWTEFHSLPNHKQSTSNYPTNSNQLVQSFHRAR